MKKSIIIILIMSMILFPFRVFADEPQGTFTKEELKSAYQKFLIAMCNESKNTESVSKTECELYNSSSFDINNYVTDDKIIMNYSGESDEIEYKINADGTISFIKSAEVHNGMSYDEYTKVTDNLGSNVSGIMIITMANGATLEESAGYMMSLLFSTLSNELSNLTSGNSNSFTIIDDDTEYDTSDSNIRVFKKSEVPQHIIELSELTYGNQEAYNLDGATMSTEFNKTDNDHATITSILTMKTKIDLTEIKEKSDGMLGDGTKQLQEVTDTIIDNTAKNSVDPTVAGTTNNPKTGATIASITIPALLILGFILHKIKITNIFKKI